MTNMGKIINMSMSDFAKFIYDLISGDGTPCTKCPAKEYCFTSNNCVYCIEHWLISEDKT